MKSILDELTTDLERAESLQNQLISIATGGPGLPYEYQELRRYFVDSPVYNSLIPSFIKTNRNTDQFWQFIKYEFSTYADRRQYIWGEFQELMDYLEGKNKAPADEDISDVLKRFDENGVHNVWIKALERRHTDPDGAITSARTLLETVCKHILDDMQVPYNNKNIEMSELYKLVAKELNLSSDQHSETVFKQILGGCSAVVNGLGTLRNRLGDAHGKNKGAVKPSPRHAELAVNLAGSMALFLISTWLNRKENV
ncbi:TPA: abortive infection family protein [Klebsiella oxytoca]|uniref:abortive infection family protein n=1 Tax=Klebsiella pneumoniae complex TaxID=3390273 RepID=UPI001C85F134|nr:MULTISPECIES: abortive infection family protein [Klebsiella]MDX6869822.1 abortive infection family protein [Klebsiella pneumoniae]HBU9776236.1 abortive infection family protein [Klebsiella pneumoniae]HCD2886861.1 abortive infection family protein [Klebsiella oxytoca]